MKQPDITAQTRSITIPDALVVWIAAVSLASIALLSAHNFRPAYAIAAGTALSVGAAGICRLRISWQMPASAGWMTLILLVGVLLRIGPYVWVMGWQDPGVYVNMAAYYEKHGSTFIKDSFREKLSPQEKICHDNMILDDLYKGLPEKDQQYVPYPRVSAGTLDRFKVPQLIGYSAFIPGVYIKDLTKSEYVFQFYPLHPLWMAIFSSLFGETGGGCSLSFFAVLTIIMFYRLAKMLSGGDEKTGLMAAGLLAVNPLHAFFSKFPVTEVCFLFFTVSGFYYLAAYVRDREQGNPTSNWHLPISLLLLLCAFLTRVTGYFYMPFFYLLAVSLFMTRRDPRLDERKTLFRFAVAVIMAYGLSVCYGLLYSFPYTMEQFGMSIGRPFVRNWHWTLPGLVSVLIFLPAVLRKVASRYDWNDAARHLQLLRITASAGMFLVLAGAAALAVSRYFLKGKDAFLSSTGVVAVSYLSPFAFLMLLAVFLKLWRDRETPVLQIWLATFVTFFWGVYALGVNTLPYQYYYARYLLSELLPYSLLLVVLYLGRLLDAPGKKAWAYLAVVAIAIYSLYFSACQFKGREADGAYAGLKRIANQVNKDDILFMTFEDFKLLTPLKFFFDLNIFRIEESAIKEKAGNALAAAHNGYILANSPVNRHGANLVEVIDYRQGEFEHAQKIPTRFIYANQMKLYLYRLEKSVFQGG